MSGLSVIEAAVDGNPSRFEIALPGVTADDVPKLVGLPIWNNEDLPDARQQRGGLPRSVTEVAGEIKEAWFDGKHGAVIEATFVDPVAALIRKIPRSLHLLVESLTGDSERDTIVLSTGRGAPLDVRRQLLEAVQAYPIQGGPVAEMTLAEALRTPQVVEYLREQIAPPPVRTFVAPPTERDEFRAKLYDGTFARQNDERRAADAADRHAHGAGLVEAAAQRTAAAAAEPDWVRRMRARGSNPADFGYAPAGGA